MGKQEEVADLLSLSRSVSGMTLLSAECGERFAFMNLTWFASGAILIGAFVSIFRPDNTAFPLQLDTKTRAAIALTLGALQALCQGLYTGVAWQEAAATAAATVLTAWFSAGARASVPVIILCASMLQGCAFFTPAHVVDIVAIESCVLNEWWVVSPGRMPTLEEAEKIAIKCGAQDWRQVVDLISVHRAAVVRERAKVCE